MKEQCPISDSGAIFLTGASGLVGGLLLRRLSEQMPSNIIFALSRSSNRIPRLPNTHAISGDICKPGLGLDRDLYSLLCESVGTIIHCAASTKFTLPLEHSRKANVNGTRNILDLACRAKRLKLLLHVSTVYIAGQKSGVLCEARFTDPGGWFSAYEQSKFEAEELLHVHGTGVPWIIARLSTIVGNSQTGKTSQFNYFHQLVRLVPHNRFPIMPGAPDAPVDVIPDDWATEALEAILGRKHQYGRTFTCAPAPRRLCRPRRS
ncbi:MAG: SDR family oxidoreductase [Bryobacteraceae bacterium]